MTTTESPALFLTTGDLEAAHARFNAISRAYQTLRDQANALVEAVSAEWSAADAALAAVQSKPGIDLPAYGVEYTYDQRTELEGLAAQRLASIFPWAVLAPRCRWCGQFIDRPQGSLSWRASDTEVTDDVWHCTESASHAHWPSI